jgi:hypothetical protein
MILKKTQKGLADYCKAIFQSVGAALACVKSRQNGNSAGNALRYDIFIFNPNLSQISLKMNKNSYYGGLHHRVGRLECSRLVKHVAEPSKLCRVLPLFKASVCPNLRGNTYVFSTLSTHRRRRYLRTCRTRRKGPRSYSSLLLPHRGRRNEVAGYPEGPGASQQDKWPSPTPFRGGAADRVA